MHLSVATVMLSVTPAPASIDSRRAATLPIDLSYYFSLADAFMVYTSELFLRLLQVAMREVAAPLGYEEVARPSSAGPSCLFDFPDHSATWQP